VFAGGGMVRAVGTAFAVYLKNDDVKVSVTEGQVDLATVATTAAPDPKGAPTAESATQKLGTLRAGQTATFAKIINEINVVPLAELERRQAWRQGFLVFNGEPLSEVIAEVNRYTPMRIEIADPALNTLKVGGRFRVGEFESMFDVLEKSFGVEVAHLGDQRIQLRARGDQ
jgi:transmembrane sensor